MLNMRNIYRVSLNKMKIFKLIYFALYLIVFVSFTSSLYAYAQSNMALKDDHLEVMIEIEEQNIQNAIKKANAIEIKTIRKTLNKLH